MDESLRLSHSSISLDPRKGSPYSPTINIKNNFLFERKKEKKKESNIQICLNNTHNNFFLVVFGSGFDEAREIRIECRDVKLPVQPNQNSCLHVQNILIRVIETFVGSPNIIINIGETRFSKYFDAMYIALIPTHCTL